MTSTAVVPSAVRPLVTYWPKSNNYGPKFSRYALPWFETYYFTHKKYPSHAEIMDRFGCSLEQVDALNKHKFWLRCLDSRGMARPDLTEEFALTDRQVAAVAILTNFHDVRNPMLKLAQMRVSEEELNGWYQNPYFKKALSDRADNILGDVSVDATAQLARHIKNGNFNAIKFYYEITGKAQTKESLDVKQAMQILIEAVQKHVKDPDTLAAIAAEVQSLRAIQGL